MTNYNGDSLTIIKRVCKIPSADTTFNTELTACLDQAYDVMNMALDAVTDTPLSGLAVTTLVKAIEANIAGGLFKEENTLPIEGERTKKHILRERGEEMLKQYIATYYPPEIDAVATSEETVVREDQKMGQYHLDQSKVYDYYEDADDHE